MSLNLLTVSGALWKVYDYFVLTSRSKSYLLFFYIYLLTPDYCLRLRLTFLIILKEEFYIKIKPFVNKAPDKKQQSK